MDKTENPLDLETKYHKLATEYSKVRSHATVLKKALLDEQAKGLEMKETVRKHEQTIRKHSQEMESLMFRNDQLSKRISVLQQDLQSCNKKGKHKTNNVTLEAPDKTVIDEELQKKIVENAQLLSLMTDKDLEISNYKDKIEWLENDLMTAKTKLDEIEKKYSDAVANWKRERKANKQAAQIDVQSQSSVDSSKEDLDDLKTIKYWREESERWRAECELMRSKPNSNEQLTEYYETQLRQMIETRQLCLSETKTLWAENEALTRRLTNSLLEREELESQLENSKEELNLTVSSYKSQLDAMTEHLAAQNDKIAEQTDEVEELRRALSIKK